MTLNWTVGMWKQVWWGHNIFQQFSAKHKTSIALCFLFSALLCITARRVRDAIKHRCRDIMRHLQPQACPRGLPQVEQLRPPQAVPLLRPHLLQHHWRVLQHSLQAGQWLRWLPLQPRAHEVMQDDQIAMHQHSEKKGQCVGSGDHGLLKDFWTACKGSKVSESMALHKRGLHGCLNSKSQRWWIGQTTKNWGMDHHISHEFVWASLGQIGPAHCLSQKMLEN